MLRQWSNKHIYSNIPGTRTTGTAEMLVPSTFALVPTGTSSTSTFDNPNNQNHLKKSVFKADLFKKT